MRRLILALFALAPVLAVVGCSYGGPGMGSFPVTPPPGLIYQDTMSPLSYDYHQTPVSPGKRGESTTMYFCVPFTYQILSFAWKDDASVVNSARNGGIKTVEYADYEMFNILGVFKEFTITTYGE